jgi:AcrR family transcriptional regulator
VNTAKKRTKENPRLREQKKRAARAEILRVARGLIEAKGYSHTRMREIALAARISYQTLYNYFPAKSLILQALLTEHGEGAESSPLPAAFAPPTELKRVETSPRETELQVYCRQLRTVIERAFQVASGSRRGLWREVVADALRSPARDYCALSLLAPEGPETLREAVRGPHAAGGLDPDVDTDALASLVCRVVDSNLLQFLLQPSLSRRQAATIITEQLDLLLQPYVSGRMVLAPELAGAGY